MTTLNGWARRGPTDTERPRGRAWMATRKRILDREPICRMCGAEVARFVDHIIPISKGGDAGKTSDHNLQPLGALCYAAKNLADGVPQPKARQSIGLDGWPV